MNTGLPASRGNASSPPFAVLPDQRGTGGEHQKARIGDTGQDTGSCSMFAQTNTPDDQLRISGKRPLTGTEIEPAPDCASLSGAGSNAVPEFKRGRIGKNAPFMFGVNAPKGACANREGDTDRAQDRRLDHRRPPVLAADSCGESYARDFVDLVECARRTVGFRPVGEPLRDVRCILSFSGCAAAGPGAGLASG